MGTLSDAGGGALLYSDGIKQLQRLILDHHYMNDVMVRELEALGPVVVTAGDPQLDPNYPADRYVEVGE